MAKILVYNQDTNRMETYYRGENESMPYNTNGTLKVKEFRGSSKSNILWTDKRTLHLKDLMKEDIGNQSQHYARNSI